TPGAAVDPPGSAPAAFDARPGHFQGSSERAYRPGRSESEPQHSEAEDERPRGGLGTAAEAALADPGAAAEDGTQELRGVPTLDQVKQALSIVQSLDPPGVAGLNLRECLLL